MTNQTLFIMDIVWFVMFSLMLYYLRWRQSKKDESPHEEYIEYSSKEKLDKAWYNHNLVGLCQTCGMDDQPVIEVLFGTSFRYWGSCCVWCEELSDLTKHLKYPSLRKLRA